MNQLPLLPLGGHLPAGSLPQAPTGSKPTSNSQWPQTLALSAGPRKPGLCSPGKGGEGAARRERQRRGESARARTQLGARISDEGTKVTGGATAHDQSCVLRVRNQNLNLLEQGGLGGDSLGHLKPQEGKPSGPWTLQGPGRLEAWESIRGIENPGSLF